MVGRKTILIPLLLLLLFSIPTMGQENLPEDPTEPFIVVTTEPKEPYVQEMVRYTIRLYRHSHLQRGYFLDQNPPEMVTELYRDEQPKVVTLGGREYELIEREYLLFPQRSGNLTIPAPVFSSRDLFVQGKPSQLKVKPRSDSGEWHWLPAENIKIEQRLDLPQGGISRSMQINRTITIYGTGLTGAQLPEPEAPIIDGMEVQNLGSIAEQKIVNGIMVGQRHMRQLLIPVQAGEFTVPGIDLQWWNTAIDKPAIAKLEDTQLHVTENQAPSVTQNSTTAATTAYDSLSGKDELETDIPANYYIELFAKLISLLVYGLLIWHYRLFSRLELWWKLGKQKQRFQQACKTNDQASASDALLTWGRLQWGKLAPVSILGFRERFDNPDSQRCLLDLDRANYTNNREWSGESALRLIAPLMKRHILAQKRQPYSSLPPLYH